MATANGLGIEERRRGDEIRLTLTGELDLHSAPVLVARFEASLDQGPRQIVLDLRAVGLADSTGLAALIRCRRRAVRGDAELILDVGDGAVARLLELTSLNRVFVVR